MFNSELMKLEVRDPFKIGNTLHDYDLFNDNEKIGRVKFTQEMTLGNPTNPINGFQFVLIMDDEPDKRYHFPISEEIINRAENNDILFRNDIIPEIIKLLSCQVKGE